MAWNLSSIPLTEVQVSLLVHGPNFTVAPRHPSYGEYITVIEQACMKLEPHNAEELRAKMRGALRNSQEPKRNITKQEVQALVELKKDQSRVILTADYRRLPGKGKNIIGRQGNIQSLKNRSNQQNEVQVDQPAQEDKIRRGHQ